MKNLIIFNFNLKLFFNDLSEANLEQFINLSIKNHQNFEKDLKNLSNLITKIFCFGFF